MAAILTLEQYKEITAQPNSEKDAQITAAIPAAERAVIDYTDRDLDLDPTLDTRVYPYDMGTTIIGIDDAEIVLNVSINGRALTEGIQYQTGSARREPVVSWIEIMPYAVLQDPLFSYTHNVPLEYRETFTPGYPYQFQNITVEATFGWPGSEIPATATQAAVWLVEEMIDPGSDATGKAAESIADLAYVYRGEEPSSEHPALPPRVAQILTSLKRVSL